MEPKTLRFGTRGSKLARWQTAFVAELLGATWPGLVPTTHLYQTEGDRRLDVPLPEIGGKGLFTEALERALLAGEIDAAVHSLKDLPTDDAPGLTVGAVPAREDVRDALVAPQHGTLEHLPEGAIVGTSSPRRAAQLLRLRPDLDIRSIRGNVETRLRKVHEGLYDAAVFACAGLLRLGLIGEATEVLPLDVMLPAPGQGALGIQCRTGDSEVRGLLAGVEELQARAATHAERTFLSALGGGCSAPIAAYAAPHPAGLHLQGRVLSLDGQTMVEVGGEGPDPEVLAHRLAAEALEAGAQAILSPQAHG